MSNEESVQLDQRITDATQPLLERLEALERRMAELDAAQEGGVV